MRLTCLHPVALALLIAPALSLALAQQSILSPTAGVATPLTHTGVQPQNLQQDGVTSFFEDYRVCSFTDSEQKIFKKFYGGGLIKEQKEVVALRRLSDLYASEPAISANIALQRAKSQVDKLIAFTGGRALSSVTPQDIASATAMPGREDKQHFLTQTEASVLQEALFPGIATADHTDLICSFSLLPWTEAADTLGRRVANNFLVAQVTLRNLDNDHEFLLHDVQAMLNTGRFYATHDRKIVRGVAEVGQAVSARNIVINGATAIGSSTGVAQGILSSQGQLGLNIWQSGLIPGLRLVFPDNTIRQIGRLDDLGFSSGSSTMVIARGGAIAVLVFLPQKSVLHPCIPLPATTPSADVNCAPYGLRRHINNAFLKPTEKTYHDFSGPEINSLEERLFILAAGNNVAAVDKTPKTSVGTFTCTPATFGRLFEDADTKIPCSLTGTALDKLTTIRLASLTDSANPTPIATVVPTPDDPTRATALFQSCALNNLPAGLYRVEADSGTDKIGQAATFNKTSDATLHPILTADIADSQNQKVTIKLPGIGATEAAKIASLTYLGAVMPFVAADSDSKGIVFEKVANTGSPIIAALFAGSTVLHPACTVATIPR